MDLTFVWIVGTLYIITAIIFFVWLLKQGKNKAYLFIPAFIIVVAILGISFSSLIPYSFMGILGFMPLIISQKKRCK
jgi:hypothetical protein